MKKLITALLTTIILVGCNTSGKKNNAMDETSKNPTDLSSVNDTTPKVTGIGGIFFFSDDPKKTKEWYSKNLGLETNEWGSTFESRNANRPEEINYLQWSPFKTGNEYFAPSKKEFMINYRVQNIEGLVKKLQTNGVTILDTMETFEYGKFIHIMDADGNKIELWEPIDSVLTKIDSKTTK
jgi:predicted enzyme related to lactoylglutathione lyase